MENGNEKYEVKGQVVYALTSCFAFPLGEGSGCSGCTCLPLFTFFLLLTQSQLRQTSLAHLCRQSCTTRRSSCCVRMVHLFPFLARQKSRSHFGYDLQNKTKNRKKKKKDNQSKVSLWLSVQSLRVKEEKDQTGSTVSACFLLHLRIN